MSSSFTSSSISVKFSDEASVSDTWDLGGYRLKFVRLSPNDELRVSPGDFIKVIEGMTSDPLRLSMVGPFEKASTAISEDIIKCRTTTYLLIISVQSALKVITSPLELSPQGPFSENLVWRRAKTFKEEEEIEFYCLEGWKVQGPNSKTIATVNAWAAGSGVNCGNRNYSELGDNTRRVLNLCISNGSGLGGIVWVRDGEEYTLPLLAGEESGPFWEWSEDLTKVVYPVHRWQAGISEISAYDFWLTIELPALKSV